VFFLNLPRQSPCVFPAPAEATDCRTQPERHLDLQRDDSHRRPGLWQQFQRLIGQRIGLVFQHRGLRGIETERGFQFGEEAALGIALPAVGKSSEQGDRQDGFLLFRIHGHSPAERILRALFPVRRA